MLQSYLYLFNKMYLDVNFINIIKERFDTILIFHIMKHYKSHVTSCHKSGCKPANKKQITVDYKPRI